MTADVESFRDKFLRSDPLIGIILHRLHVDNEEITLFHPHTIGKGLILGVYTTGGDGRGLDPQRLVETAHKVF